MALYYDYAWHDLIVTELYLAFMTTLSSITPNPPAFREMMRSTNTIISGSTALHYLLRHPHSWYPSDVDLLVPAGQMDIVVNFICQLPGANVMWDVGDNEDVDDDDDDEEEEGNGYPQLFHIGFVRLVKVVTSMGHFDIMQSREPSAFNPIPYYWGTHVMNALTADQIYCAYPTFTFRQQGIVTIGQTLPRTMNIVTKYRQRGFHLYDSSQDAWEWKETCTHFVACAKRDRFFGDDDTLVLPIRKGRNDKEDSCEETVTESYITGWRLGGSACGNARCFIPSEATVCCMTRARDKVIYV